MKYNASLDGLRGFAVISVVLYHLGIIPGGYLGVSVFFTLSGYLITTNLIHQHRQGSVNLWQFYRRRITRLGPAAAAVIIVTAVASVQLGRLNVVDESEAFAAAFWHYNWHTLSQEFVYGGSSKAALGHFWSLAIEEQFYILYPWVVVLGLRFRNGLKVLLTSLVMTSLLGSFLLDNYFNSFARVFEILAGCLVAVTSIKLPKKMLAFLIVLVGFFLLSDLPADNDLPNFTIIAVTLVTVLIVSTIRHHDSKILSNQILVKCGVYSYSLYLWHWPVIVLLEGWWRLIMVPLTVLSYHLIEKPIRNGGR